MGDGYRFGGVAGCRGIGSNDSMPGSRKLDWLVAGAAIGGGGLGPVVSLTAESWFDGWLRLSGCQVRRRHESSPLLDTESRRVDHPEDDAVGDALAGAMAAG